MPEHFNLPWRLTIENGSLQTLGLELFWSDMSGGSGQMIRGFQNDSLDLAVILTEGITKAILQGLEVKILGIYVTTPLHWGIHVPYHSKIKKLNQLQDQTFAISRKGSGSELMAHVLAKREGWDSESLKFNVVGDIYGALWALENGQAEGFLWDKYMTSPYCEKKKCRYIGEIVTPWPPFVVAVKSSYYEKYKEQLEKMLRRVHQEAKVLKQNPKATEVISWRYNIGKEKVKTWLAETDWNYDTRPYHQELKETVDYLLKLNLVTSEEARQWEEKLF